jgi:glycosyltransferase involved in cell wall biosynthesis
MILRKKNDLFTIADLYIQPGWVGLSVVEAMAYGKPILTFVRSEETLQCVEYSYLLHKNNSLIFESLDDCCTKLEKITKEDINKMGDNARAFVKNNLTMKNMVNLASNSFN